LTNLSAARRRRVDRQRGVGTPYSPINGLLGFTPLPPTFLALLAGIIALYVLTAELAKKRFYQHMAW
jgi:Mg2+-importing ATPase